MVRTWLPWGICAVLACLLAARSSLPKGLFAQSAQAESALITVPRDLGAQEAAAQTPKAVYEIADLLKQRRESAKAYFPFLGNATMDLGIYALAKGSVDGQSPHALDEIYYVVAGKAKIRIKGTDHPVKAGSVIFVAAGDEHQFIDIEEDLDLLVFFSKAPPQKAPEKAPEK